MADFIVVGAGLFGVTFARCMAEAGKTIRVIEKSDHIGGTCRTDKIAGIHVHKHGPHVFHTNESSIWQFVNQFSKFESYPVEIKVCNKRGTFPFPINLQTLQQLWGVNSAEEAESKLAQVREPQNRENMERYVLSQLGRELYEIFVFGYCFKKWQRPPAELPASMFKVPRIRMDFDSRYYTDRFCGVPKEGYTSMFENMLDHKNICINLGVDFADHRGELLKEGQVVYSGKVDELCGFEFGELEYQSLRFEHEILPISRYQDVPIMCYGDLEVPYTRVTEHKQITFSESSRTVITKEYPQKHDSSNAPYYPIETEENLKVFQKYKKRAAELGVILGGRLGSYRYFDMNQVIGQAMQRVQESLRGSFKTT